MGDKSVHGFIVALRAVATTDFMTADTLEEVIPQQGQHKDYE
jgi:GMP synthase PP-ATPase subunit